MNKSQGLMLLAAILTLSACKDEDKTPTTTSGTVATAAQTAAATTAAPAQPTAASAVVVSPEMTAFMAMLDGKDGSASKALKKYGTAAVANDDLGMYTLQNPKVSKSEKVGDLQCFTMLSEAGVMKHTTQTCWDAKGKIAKITDASE
jgi:hypothetical protein